MEVKTSTKQVKVLVIFKIDTTFRFSILAHDTPSSHLVLAWHSLQTLCLAGPSAETTVSL